MNLVRVFVISVAFVMDEVIPLLGNAGCPKRRIARLRESYRIWMCFDIHVLAGVLLLMAVGQEESVAHQTLAVLERIQLIYPN